MTTEAPKKPGKGIQSLAQRRTDELHIAPSLIHVREGFNGRDWNDPANHEHVAHLADQILAEGGIRQPLTVYMDDGVVCLEHGECRLRAVPIVESRGLQIPTVPVRVSKSRDEADRVAGMLMDNSGKPFSTLETAGVVRRLLDAGKDFAWIAQRTGYTLVRLKQLVDVAALPEPVQEQVAEGTISATEAVRVVKQHGEEAPAIIEQAAALSTEEGGAKAGRATRATLEAVTRPQNPESGPADPEPEDQGHDLVAELEVAQREIARLTTLVASLQSTDQGREIVALHAQNAQLNGRLQKALESNAEARKSGEYMSGLLKKIRTALGVEKNSEITEAIESLKN